MRTRKPIPKTVADRVLFDADRTCCVCQQQRKHVVLHHIDGNPENNAVRNLAVLCLDHHDEASKRSGLSRNLSSGLVRNYMRSWLRKVRTQRAHIPASPRNRLTQREVLEALAIHEIRKINDNLMGAAWDRKLEFLIMLYPFTDFRYGYDVRTELLDSLHHLAGLSRFGMTYKVACMVEKLADSVLPIFSLVGRARVKPKKRDVILLRQAVEIGLNLVHDASKYLKDLGVLAEGATILWTVLRFAHLNNLQKLEADVLREFQTLEYEAGTRRFRDAKRWLEFERLDALALDEKRLPEMPKDIADKLWELSNPKATKKSPERAV